MYEVFGEFDSAEEINQAAVGILNEGDHKNILILAKENGIDEEMAKAFIDGDIPVITDTLTAAVGKIELERKDIKDPFFNDMKDDMINYLLTACMDDTFARAVRKKGKSLKGCFNYCSGEIKKALGSKNGGLRDRAVYSMERDYYLKKEAVIHEEKVAGEDTTENEDD